MPELGIDKFWMFSVRCLELPPSKLESDYNVLKSYLSIVNHMIHTFDLRLKEDAFALLGVAKLKDNILNQDQNSPNQKQGITSKFIKQSSSNDLRSEAETIIKKIVQDRKYKNIEGIGELLSKLKHLNIFEMLCHGMNEGEGKSINPENYLFVPVHVAEILDANPQADIGPEVMKTIQRSIVRTYNVLVLEEIKKNIETFLTPPQKGFDHKLIKGFY